MGDLLFKVHESYRLVVSICDKELYGRKLKEGVKALDLTGLFFKGEEMEGVQVREEMIKLIRDDATFNIVGKKAVGIALEIGIIDKEGVLNIDGIPYALVLL